MTLQTWDHVRFTDLQKVDPVLAWEYRRDCGLGEVPEEFQRVKEPTIEQLKELLKTNSVEFHHKVGYDKLKELAIANNLI